MAHCGSHVKAQFSISMLVARRQHEARVAVFCDPVAVSRTHAPYEHKPHDHPAHTFVGEASRTCVQNIQPLRESGTSGPLAALRAARTTQHHHRIPAGFAIDIILCFTRGRHLKRFNHQQVTFSISWVWAGQPCKHRIIFTARRTVRRSRRSQLAKPSMHRDVLKATKESVPPHVASEATHTESDLARSDFVPDRPRRLVLATPTHDNFARCHIRSCMVQGMPRSTVCLFLFSWQSVQAKTQ